MTSLCSSVSIPMVVIASIVSLYSCASSVPSTQAVVSKVLLNQRYLEIHSYIVGMEQSSTYCIAIILIQVIVVIDVYQSKLVFSRLIHPSNQLIKYMKVSLAFILHDNSTFFQKEIGNFSTHRLTGGKKNFNVLTLKRNILAIKLSRLLSNRIILLW